MDLVLSAGFLAFAEQAGFLAAVEDTGLEVDAVCGTSSGALAGALWAAGVPAHAIFELLCEAPPVRWVRPSRRPWRGVFRLDAVVDEMRRHLPETFDGLHRPLAAGVVEQGTHRLVTDGPLPLAVAASCAVPFLFEPVRREGRVLVDGGAADRAALGAWRAWRPGREAVLHLVDSARGTGDHGSTDLGRVVVCSSARAGATLWSMGDAQARFHHTRGRTRRTLETLLA